MQILRSLDFVYNLRECDRIGQMSTASLIHWFAKNHTGINLISPPAPSPPKRSHAEPWSAASARRMRVMQSTVVVNQLYHKRHLKMFYAVRMLGRCSRVSICNLTTLNARRQFGKGPRSRYLQTESKSAWRTWDAVEKAPGLRGGIYMRKKSVDYGYQIVFF